jgi:transposase-like protein
LLEQWGEDNDRTCRTEVTELFAFRDGGYSVAPRLQNIECPQCSRGTEPIGVCLDHRQQRYACPSGDGCSITLQRAKIDLDPGAR